MEQDTTADQLTADNYFAIIPEWVLDLPVSSNAVRCYALLQRYANNKQKCWPSRTLLASRMNCSTDTIDRAVKELVTHKAVVVQQRQTAAGAPTSNIYTVILNQPGVPAPLRRGTRKDAEGVSAPVRTKSKKKNHSQESLLPSTEVEVVKPKPLDQEIAEQWWQSRKKKPLGKSAWWSLRSLIQAALDSKYEPQEIIDALNRQQTIPTLATFDRELQKLRPGDYHQNRRNQMLRVAEALETGEATNPFQTEPEQKELNP